MSNRTIYKFPLDLGRFNHADGVAVEGPGPFTPLTTAMQAGKLCVWCECDPHKPKKKRRFWILGTGITVPPMAQIFVGTSFDASALGRVGDFGTLVYHVWTEYAP